MLGGLIGLGVACLLAPVFAEYAGIREKAEKGFSLIAGAGILYLLAQAFQVNVFVNNVSQFATGGSMLFQVIGLIFTIVGVVWAAFKLAAGINR